jgi:GNAT superfamily N-acetyltransferase
MGAEVSAVFELNDAIIDAIIFAMEDQDSRRVIDLENGEVDALGSNQHPEGAVPPPAWSSRDGYRLMEEFLRSVRSPGARHELGAALNRGRGVFKAFKEALAAFPDAERAFHDYKLKMMRAEIRRWYDDLREARGLERLGLEPEETEDLIADDFGISTGSAAEARDCVLDLAAMALDEALEVLPEVLAEREGEVLEKALAGEDWIASWIEDGENGAIAAAAAAREHAAGRSFGRIFFVYVTPEFRRQGMARSLLDALIAAFKAEGVSLVSMDAPFLTQDFSAALETSGLVSYGARGYFRV